MLLSLNSRLVGDVSVIECVGRVVLGDEVKALEGALEAAERESARIVLNLAEVNRLDSVAMGLLVRHAERLSKRGGGLRLGAPPPFVVTLLHMTKLSDLLLSYPTEEEAIVSFLRQRSARETQARSGPKVLVFDESADLCVFVRTVLAGHGYDVRTTCSFRDAKILLKTDGAEYLVVGPSTPRLSAGAVLETLTGLSPASKVVRLDAEFKLRDAREATNALLQLFGVSGN